MRLSQELYYHDTRLEEIMSERIIDLKRKNIEKALLDQTYEYCIVCWTKTDTQKATPIPFRNFYVEGVGQLCAECYLGLTEGES